MTPRVVDITTPLKTRTASSISCIKCEWASCGEPDDCRGKPTSPCRNRKELFALSIYFCATHLLHSTRAVKMEPVRLRDSENYNPSNAALWVFYIVLEHLTSSTRASKGLMLAYVFFYPTFLIINDDRITKFLQCFSLYALERPVVVASFSLEYSPLHTPYFTPFLSKHTAVPD